MKTGIIVAEDGKTLDDLPLAYSSLHGHIKVDSRPELNRLKIYEGRCGEQVLAVQSPSFGTNTTKEEVFLKIPHKLKYVPRVSVYMLIRDAPAHLAGIIGYFAGGVIAMDGFPAFESIFFRVDDTNVYLVHSATTLDTAVYNSILQNVIIRARIIINSNTVAGEPYTSSNAI